MKSTWEEIWQDRNIKFKNKEKEFEKRTRTNLLNELYYDFIGVKWENSIATNAKFLKEMETYLEQKINDLNRFAERELTKRYRRKNTLRDSQIKSLRTPIKKILRNILFLKI